MGGVHVFKLLSEFLVEEFELLFEDDLGGLEAEVGGEVFFGEDANFFPELGIWVVDEEVFVVSEDGEVGLAVFVYLYFCLVDFFLYYMHT